MYAAYQLTDLRLEPLRVYLKSGEGEEKELLARVRRSLETFLSPSGSIDAERMMNEWFPDIDVNVFISHSRADKDLALALAGLLREMGLKPFVDSCVWHHADSLLRIIDEHCCKTGPNLFSYEKSLITASHVNIMLASAITKMMDRCEGFFFLSTPNSLGRTSPENMVAEGGHVTHSAWLFHEISMLQLLRKRSKADHRSLMENVIEGKVARASTSKPEFDYPVTLSGVPSLSVDDLSKWRNALPLRLLSLIEKREPHALDVLYGIVPPHHEM